MSPHAAPEAGGPFDRRWVPLAGVLLLTGIVVAAAIDLLRGHAAVRDEVERRLQAHARLVAEQTHLALHAADLALQRIAQDRDGNGPGLGAGNQGTGRQGLRNGGAALVGQVAWFDARGRLQAGAWPAQETATTLAGAPVFERLRLGPPGGAEPGVMVRSEPGGGPTVVLARRRMDPHGAFDGVTTVLIGAAELAAFHGSAALEPGMSTRLVHRDDSMPIHDPRPAGVPAGASAPSAAVDPAAADEFSAVARVPGYPIEVAVSQERRQALKTWRTQATGTIARALILAMLAAILLRMLQRVVVRLDRARVSLAESRERFALAVAGANDGICDRDLVARTVFSSARARELLGLTDAPEVMSLADWEGRVRFHPEDAARRAASMAAHLEGRAPADEGEYRVLHPDGSTHWVRIRSVCRRDAQGRPLRLAGSVSDIDGAKRAEQALRASEERFALAMAGSNEAHWVWDLRSDEVFASPLLGAMFRLSVPLTPITRSALLRAIHVHRDDRRGLLAAVSRHLGGQSSRIDIEHRVVDRQHGGVRWIHTRAQAFGDADGRPQRVGGTTVDITDRKRAEQALRDSEERLALALAGANDGILDCDLASERLFASERALHLLGLQAATLPRDRRRWVLRALRRVHREDLSRMRSALRGNAPILNRAIDAEIRVRSHDGSHRWIRLRGRSVKDAAGRDVRWVGALSDIDTLKRTEEALRQSEERYQLAALGSNEGLWDWDLRSDQLFLSSRCQALVSIEAGEPLQPRRVWTDQLRLHPDDVVAVRRGLRAHLRGQTRHFEVEYRLSVPGGLWRWMRQRGVALRDERGRPFRMAGSLEDVTGRRDAEDARERLEQQLRQAQKLEAMGTLAGGIAHDFNNILSAILGYGEMALGQTADGTPLRRYVEASLSAGLRAKSLVERILAFSRSGVGEKIPVNVQSVVAEALTLLRASLPAGVDLVASLDAGDAAVVGDPTQILQVVMNLCANSVQAVGQAGRLEVGLDLVEWSSPRDVTTCTLPAGPYVRLRVVDSGAGIPPRIRERIFDPFFTTKEVGVGTGLGLSLVHGIVGDLGGGIDVDSEVGVGTTMTVYVPQQGERLPPERTEDRPQPGRGETILLVDDEPPLVDLGEEMLAALGYDAVGFTSSLAALRSFRRTPERFDLVLTDESMPEMTGSELAREIRRIRPDLPILIVTGHATPLLLRQAREIGVAEVLAKPMSSRTAGQALARALRAGSSLEA